MAYVHQTYVDVINHTQSKVIKREEESKTILFRTQKLKTNLKPIYNTRYKRSLSTVVEREEGSKTILFRTTQKLKPNLQFKIQNIIK